MPYTPAQCRLFGAKESRGEKVPADWHAHCTKKEQKKATKRKKHTSTKTRATHNHN